jgi:hypothetical protein
MTPEYRARRDAKHAAQLASKPPVSGGFVQTIDLTPKTPRLAWLGGKLLKSSRGGLKNCSGHSLEHSLGNRDNKNPYLGADGKWFWYDETEQDCETGYVTREQAEIALNDYVKWLNSPHEILAEGLEAIKKLSENPAIVTELAERGLRFDNEEIERSIGGIREDLLPVITAPNLYDGLGE